jgi:hypothetical protein
MKNPIGARPGVPETERVESDAGGCVRALHVAAKPG